MSASISKPKKRKKRKHSNHDDGDGTAGGSDGAKMNVHDNFSTLPLEEKSLEPEDNVVTKKAKKKHKPSSSTNVLQKQEETMETQHISNMTRLPTQKLNDIPVSIAKISVNGPQNIQHTGDMSHLIAQSTPSSDMSHLIAQLTTSSDMSHPMAQLTPLSDMSHPMAQSTPLSDMMPSMAQSTPSSDVSRRMVQSTPSSDASHCMAQSTPSSSNANADASHPIYSLLVASEIQQATAQDEDGDTPLHIAVSQCEVDMVHQLLFLISMADHPVDPINNLHQTPLHIAIITRQPELAADLIEAGADPNICDRYGNTSMHLACIHKCAPIMYALLQGRYIPQLMSKNFEGYIPLHLAVIHGEPDIVNILVRNKPSHIDCTDTKNGWTALFHAAARDGEGMIDILLQADPDINCQSYSGNTALHIASGRGYTEVVRKLMQSGADMSVRNSHRESPAMITTDRVISNMLHGKDSHPGSPTSTSRQPLNIRYSRLTPQSQTSGWPLTIISPSSDNVFNPFAKQRSITPTSLPNASAAVPTLTAPQVILQPASPVSLLPVQTASHIGRASLNASPASSLLVQSPSHVGRESGNASPASSLLAESPSHVGRASVNASPASSLLAQSPSHVGRASVNASPASSLLVQSPYVGRASVNASPASSLLAQSPSHVGRASVNASPASSLLELSPSRVGRASSTASPVSSLLELSPSHVGRASSTASPVSSLHVQSSPYMGRASVDTGPASSLPVQSSPHLGQDHIAHLLRAVPKIATPIKSKQVVGYTEYATVSDEPMLFDKHNQMNNVLKEPAANTTNSITDEEVSEITANMKIQSISDSSTNVLSHAISKETNRLTEGGFINDENDLVSNSAELKQTSGLFKRKKENVEHKEKTKTANAPIVKIERKTNIEDGQSLLPSIGKTEDIETMDIETMDIETMDISISKNDPSLKVDKELPASKRQLAADADCDKISGAGEQNINKCKAELMSDSEMNSVNCDHANVEKGKEELYMKNSINEKDAFLLFEKKNADCRIDMQSLIAENNEIAVDKNPSDSREEIITDEYMSKSKIDCIPSDSSETICSEPKKETIKIDITTSNIAENGKPSKSVSLNEVDGPSRHQEIQEKLQMHITEKSDVEVTHLSEEVQSTCVEHISVEEEQIVNNSQKMCYDEPSSVSNISLKQIGNVEEHSREKCVPTEKNSVQEKLDVIECPSSTSGEQTLSDVMKNKLSLNYSNVQAVVSVDSSVLTKTRNEHVIKKMKQDKLDETETKSDKLSSESCNNSTTLKLQETKDLEDCSHGISETTSLSIIAPGDGTSDNLTTDEVTRKPLKRKSSPAIEDVIGLVQMDKRPRMENNEQNVKHISSLQSKQDIKKDLMNPKKRGLTADIDPFKTNYVMSNVASSESTISQVGMEVDNQLEDTAQSTDQPVCSNFNEKDGIATHKTNNLPSQPQCTLSTAQALLSLSNAHSHLSTAPNMKDSYSTNSSIQNKFSLPIEHHSTVTSKDLQSSQDNRIQSSTRIASNLDPATDNRRVSVIVYPPKEAKIPKSASILEHATLLKQVPLDVTSPRASSSSPRLTMQECIKKELPMIRHNVSSQEVVHSMSHGLGQVIRDTPPIHGYDSVKYRMSGNSSGLMYMLPNQKSSKDLPPSGELTSETSYNVVPESHSMKNVPTTSVFNTTMSFVTSQSRRQFRTDSVYTSTTAIAQAPHVVSNVPHVVANVPHVSHMVPHTVTQRPNFISPGPHVLPQGPHVSQVSHIISQGPYVGSQVPNHLDSRGPYIISHAPHETMPNHLGHQFASPQSHHQRFLAPQYIVSEPPPQTSTVFIQPPYQVGPPAPSNTSRPRCTPSQQQIRGVPIIRYPIVQEPMGRSGEIPITHSHFLLPHSQVRHMPSSIVYQTYINQMQLQKASMSHNTLQSSELDQPMDLSCKKKPEEPLDMSIPKQTGAPSVISQSTSSTVHPLVYIPPKTGPEVPMSAYLHLKKSPARLIPHQQVISDSYLVSKSGLDGYESDENKLLIDDQPVTANESRKRSKKSGKGKHTKLEQRK